MDKRKYDDSSVSEKKKRIGLLLYNQVLLINGYHVVRGGRNWPPSATSNARSQPGVATASSATKLPSKSDSVSTAILCRTFNESTPRAKDDGPRRRARKAASTTATSTTWVRPPTAKFSGPSTEMESIPGSTGGLLQSWTLYARGSRKSDDASEPPVLPTS